MIKRFHIVDFVNMIDKFKLLPASQVKKFLIIHKPLCTFKHVKTFFKRKPKKINLLKIILKKNEYFVD